jgi:ATP-binding cassette, subfamily F, member 3
MVSVDQLTVTFGGEDLFKDITFVVNPRDRIGLVGKNGCGKSTLLKIFAGKQQPDGGKVSIPSDITVGYLPQQMVHFDGRTVFDETISAFADIINIEKEIEHITEELTRRTDYESDGYMDLIHDLTSKNERFHMLGGASLHADVEQTLLGLGFEPSDFTRQTTEFSGGWRMRIELAKILLRRPNVFLLDEPTNHLDIESIQWLEMFLKDYPGAAVIVSHDRAFLDNVTNRTVEILLGNIHDYDASYSRYVVLRRERREQQMASYVNQQKMIAETEDFISRFRYKATKATQVQSRIKQLDKIDRIEVDEEDLSVINMKFPPAPRSGVVVVEVKGLSKRFGKKEILENVDLVIERGEKVAFVGRNGEGKSTLSKIIVGETDHEGELKLGHNVNLGYFAQNQDEIMDGNNTVFGILDDIAVGEIRTKIRDILGAFLFRGEEIDKKVKVLSGGERSRLAMAKLLLEPHNLLVLDEPTNHMDMRSKDILKQAMMKYDGTLIIVSHDREFLDGLVGKVYEFKNKKVKENIGGIYDFLQRKKLESLQELERKAKPIQKDVTDTNFQVRKKHPGKSESDKEVRRLTSQIAESEKKISDFEKQINSMDQTLAKPDLVTDASVYQKYEQLKKNMQVEISFWENLSVELENYKNK